jgi:serine/threonine-protein kinase
MGTGRDVLDAGAVVGETYRIGSLLGRGGMGAVWAAEHLRLPGKRVAVKVLLDPAAAGEEMFQRFRREAEIASRLGHPNIIEVLDFNLLPSGQPYIVLEYLQGETLARRLRSGRVPLDESLAIARQIGSALQAAHRAGVVHRDLKPDNVFLCVPEEDVPTRVKVLDFGISKIRGSGTLATADSILMGTPQYMSPEQAVGRNSELDARTDLFALGAIVYEMLAGEPAFAGGSLAQVVYRVVHVEPAPLRSLVPDLPDEVVSSVERALSKSADDRQPDVATFIHELTGRPLHGFSTAKRAELEATLITPPGESLEAKLDATLPSSPRVPPPERRSRPARPSAVATPRGPIRPGQRPARMGAWAVVALVALAAAGGVAVGRRAARGRASVPVTPVSSMPPPGTIPILPREPPVGTPSPPERPRPAVAATSAGAVSDHRPSGLSPERSERPRPAVAASEIGPTSDHRSGGLSTERAERPGGPGANKLSGMFPGSAGEPLPAEARALLERAEEALRLNQPQEATRLVDQSFFIQKSSRGYAIQTRAACARHDIGAARAAFRNVTNPGQRSHVRSACARRDILLP